MDAVEIKLMDPFTRALGRTKARLFQPFALATWLVLGFTSWLANLGSNGGGGLNLPLRGFGRGAKQLPEIPDPAAVWRLVAPYLVFIVAGLILLVVLGVVLGVVLAWVKARFQFIFLDNLLRGNRDLRRPWDEYCPQGNSLFLWRVVYALCVLALFALAVAGPAVLGYQAVQAQDLLRLLVIVVAAVLVLLPLLLLNGFVLGLLTDFVVPLMYRYRVTTNAGWALLLPRLKSHFWHFVLYYLFLLVLGVAVALVVLVLGCATCRVGFVLLMLPYVGAVLLLPVQCCYRFFSVEYLNQFSAEYDFFPEAGPAPPALPGEPR